MEKKKTLLAAGAAIAAAAVLGIAAISMPKKAASDGSKQITVEVIHKDGSKKEYKVTTDAQYLDDALEAEDLIAGEEGDYGLFVTEVDGETADFNTDGGWWQLSVNGTPAESGVSDIPAEDQDVITWSYEQ